MDGKEFQPEEREGEWEFFMLDRIEHRGKQYRLVWCMRDASPFLGVINFEAELARLDTIDGVNRRTAEVLITELRVDMAVFPSDRHQASWAALCAGNNESTGKHKSGKTRKGNRWLRTVLTEAALAAVNTKSSALAARYRRVMRHRGHEKAVVAVAHAILRMAYHLLSRGTTYQDLGADYFDRRHAERVTRRALALLERQGYRVTLDRAA